MSAALKIGEELPGTWLALDGKKVPAFIAFEIRREAYIIRAQKTGKELSGPHQDLAQLLKDEPFTPDREGA